VYKKQKQKEIEEAHIKEDCIQGYAFKKGRFSEVQRG
jgi:hypothetical protein